MDAIAALYKQGGCVIRMPKERKIRLSIETRDSDGAELFSKLYQSNKKIIRGRIGVSTGRKVHMIDILTRVVLADIGGVKAVKARGWLRYLTGEVSYEEAMDISDQRWVDVQMTKAQEEAKKALESTRYRAGSCQ